MPTMQSSGFESDYQFVGDVLNFLQHIRRESKPVSSCELKGIFFRYDLNTGEVELDESPRADRRVNNIFPASIVTKNQEIIKASIAAHAKLTFLKRLADEITKGELREKILELHDSVYEAPGDVRVNILKAYDSLSYNRRTTDIFSRAVNNESQCNIVSVIDKKTFNGISCINQVNDLIDRLKTSAEPDHTPKR